MRICLTLVLGLATLLLPGFVAAQTTNATITGQITDSQKAVIVGARVAAVNTGTNARFEVVSNGTGSYVIPNLPPGPYRVEVERAGFKTVVETGVVLHVQDTVELNYEIALGATSESVTVTADTTNINTTDASVSTVVDRNFAENLPMNGRSFQTLIQLTPGVVVTASNAYDSGQFSVNGQRAASNYWMVDGVGANIGVGPSYYQQGNGVSGAMPSFSIQGGTNGLVSVDAMQEFRIQTSTYAPEFGRTPGGQISIVTRSGTNQWHGAAFDYLRNDKLDANNWFADANGLPKPEERQNDFGAVLGGPILKDRTFFFFSYEGLRLRLPQTALSTVPDLAARQNAIPAMQPYLNAFPFDPAQPDLGKGIAQFNASFSNKSTLDAYSIRIDHKLNDNLTLFGRYNYSPSNLSQRGLSNSALNDVSPASISTQTGTAGATWNIAPSTVNDLRFNYSRTNAHSYSYLDSFGGAVPLASLPFPSGFTSSNGAFAFIVVALSDTLGVGTSGHNLQRQINIVDNLSVQKGSHSLRFGIDFRRLSPLYEAPPYYQQPVFLDVPSAEAGNLLFSEVIADRAAKFLLYNLGAFAEDTWRVEPRLTITYGLRWDVDFAPSSTPILPAVMGFNLNDLSNLALAPDGTPPFKTPYGNVAPRLGIAYQLRKSQDWQAVLRGGFGVFYDLATSELGNLLYLGSYPFGSSNFGSGGSFPFTAAKAAPPPITVTNLLTSSALYAFNPNMKLPYTLEWNVALEQSLGHNQTISGSYIGSAGRRLIQTGYVGNPNPSFAALEFVTNAGSSDYDALQLQYQRRLSRGLQALASYTWSHSIDTASAGSLYGLSTLANALAPGINPNANRGPSDFDIRNGFSLGVTYDIAVPKMSAFTSAILREWSLESFVLARSAPPLDIGDGSLAYSTNPSREVRPDVVPGQPIYLYGSEYPGGKAVNTNAFTLPPTDANGVPVRQGDLGRNALRAFGATQWDFAVHRNFPIHESVKLQFRAEMFNVLNHPNFGPPVSDLSNTTQFGKSTQTLAQALGGANIGGGGFSALYQIGGPRSIQLALKLLF